MYLTKDMVINLDNVTHMELNLSGDTVRVNFVGGDKATVEFAGEKEAWEFMRDVCGKK